MTVFSENKLRAFFLSVIILSSVINWDFYHVRVSDLLIISFLLLLTTKISRGKILLFGFVLVLLLLSDLVSFFRIGFESMHNVIIYYKYLIVLLFCFSVSYSFKYFKLVNFEVIRNSLKYVLFLLLGWIYLSFYILGEDYLNSVGRPSYPFTRDYSISDAHLLSSVCSILFIFYNVYANPSKFIRVALLFITINALIITGSRTGFVLIAVFGLTSFFLRLFFDKFKIINIILFAIWVISSILIISFFIFFSPGMFSEVRALNFDFMNDMSSGLRIQFLQEAIYQSKLNNFILGIGPINSNGFYDGMLASLIANGGLSLIVILLIVLIGVLYELISKKSLVLSSKIKITSFFLTICVANIITEHIFVTRSMIVFVVVLLYSYYCNLEYSKSLREKLY